MFNRQILYDLARAQLTPHKHVIKDVDHAEMAEVRHARVSGNPKLHGKSLGMTLPKPVNKAIHAHEKSIKKDHKMAGKLAKAER